MNINKKIININNLVKKIKNFHKNTKIGLCHGVFDLLHLGHIKHFEEAKKISGIEKAKLVGKEFTKNCLKSGIVEIVFDKGAYIYTGRVKALAEACREAGLKF